MKRSGILTGTAAALGMLLLILDTPTALNGAIEGMELCIRTIIPSLFPFFVLSILLKGSLMGTPIPLLRPIGKWMGIPRGAESILIAGFLGGYPVGGQAVATAGLSEGNARRMLAFCNNAGPAFIFGMAGVLFPCRWMAWTLWGIHIFSAGMVSMLIPKLPAETIEPGTNSRISLTRAMQMALRVMAGVCGWVILFRVVIAFLDRWFGWMLPETGRVILAGILELSNGCCSLNAIENLGLRFVVCAGFLAFGGLCVSMQTWTVTEGIRRDLYFPGKILQTLISVLLALAVQVLLPFDSAVDIPVSIPLLLLGVIGIFPRILRNKSGNPGLVGV